MKRFILISLLAAMLLTFTHAMELDQPEIDDVKSSLTKEDLNLMQILETEKMRIKN